MIKGLPQTRAKVAMQVRITRADCRAHFIDSAEIALQKGARQLPGDVLATVGIGRQIACAQRLGAEADIGRDALYLGATEGGVLRATTVGTGAAVNMLPDLCGRLTDDRIETAVREFELQFDKRPKGTILVFLGDCSALNLCQISHNRSGHGASSCMQAPSCKHLTPWW